MMFNLPAPASVEWYRPGVAGGGQPDRIFNILKAKLTGGKDDSGTSYFKLHDRSLSSGDADKIIANMKQDEDGYPMLQTSSTSGEAEREYQEWIIDRYLVDTPNATQESEDIPVEVEIIEVEQKQPDEPIVIQIEAPFESTPEQKLRAPERLRLPGIKNTFKKKKSDKKTTAQRMAEGFNKNLLDPLIETIVAPPAPLPRKKRKQKEVVSSTKSTVSVAPKVDDPKYRSTDASKAKTFNDFVGIKLKSAFTNAARARKEFIDMGGSPEDLKNRSFLKDRFITKALGFEFGGDKLARTKGMFQVNPDAQNDPGLSRGERFGASVRPLMSSTLPAPKQEEPQPAGGLGEVGIGPEIQVLNDTYADTMAAFSMAVTQFDNTVQKDTTGAVTTQAINDKINEINKLLGQKVSTEKQLLVAKQASLDIQEDTANADEAAANQAKIEEGGGGGAGFRKYLRAEGGLPNLIKMIRNLFGGKKKGDDEGGGDGILGALGSFAIDIGTELAQDKIFDRIKGEGVKKTVQQALQRGAQAGSQAVTQTAGAVTQAGSIGAATAAAIVSGAGLAASAAGEGLFQLTNEGEGALNETLKGTGVALDAIGAPFRYAVEAVRYPFLNEEDREKQAHNLAKFDARLREYTRGWMNRIDFLNVIPDEKGGFGNIYGNDEAQKEMMDKMGPKPEEKTEQQKWEEKFNADKDKAKEEWVKKRRAEGYVEEDIDDYLKFEKEFRDSYPGAEKLSEGTLPVLEEIQGPRIKEDDLVNKPMIESAREKVMIGEAGDELVASDKELVEVIDQVDATSSVTDMGAAAILGAIDTVLKQSGIFGAAARPYMTNYLAPLVKAFGMEKYSFPADIGGGAGEKSGQDMDQFNPFGGMFEGLLSFLGLTDDSTGTTRSRGTGAPIIPNLGGGEGRTTASEVYRYLLSKGMSENHAKGITANISRESGFKLGAHNPNDPGAGSFGLFQWNGGRAENMMAAVPDWQSNWQGQIDYALGEDHGPTYLATPFSSPGAAAYDWMKYWERPAADVQQRYTADAYDQMITSMGLTNTAAPSMDPQPENPVRLIQNTGPTLPASPLPAQPQQQPTGQAILTSLPLNPGPATTIPYGDPMEGATIMILPVIQRQPAAPQQQQQEQEQPEGPMKLSTFFAMKNATREVY